MTNFSHLDALDRRLASEKARLATAKTDQERQLRQVWIRQIEKEIVSERAFLDNGMSDEELLGELLS